MSTQGDGQAKRPWKEIAAELAIEQDMARFAELCAELAKALGRDKAGLPHPNAGLGNPAKKS